MMFNVYFRGLDIGYTVEDYTPAVHTLSNGDPGYPAEGGTCDHWGVEDIDDADELTMELEEVWIPKGIIDRLTRWVFFLCLRHYDKMKTREQRRVLAMVTRLVEAHWTDDIYEHCTEHYWHDLGGPGCEEDYFYDD